MYCCICFGTSADGGWAATYCGHVFHHACLQQSFDVAGQKCPRCRKKEKGRKGDFFFKLFVDDDPNASEPQEEEGDGEQVGDGVADGEEIKRLRKKIDLLNAKIESMGGALAMAREQSTADRAEITRLQNGLLACQQDLEDKRARLQKALDEQNAIASQNRRLQNEYATARLKLEREREANSRARLAFDTSITSRELSAQLALLADAGNPPPNFFQKLLEARQKALAEANIRAQKAEAAKATAEASAKEETRKLKAQIQNIKAQIEEYQSQLDILQQHQHPNNSSNNRKRPAPPTWQFDAETEEAPEIRPLTRIQPKKQQKKQQNNPNLPNNAFNRPPSRVVSSRTIGIGGLATKAHPRAALELETEIEGLIGPSSELPNMHPSNTNYMMMPPPPRNRVNNPVDPTPEQAAVVDNDGEAAAAMEKEELPVEEEEIKAMNNNYNTYVPGTSVVGANGVAAAPESSNLEKFRQHLLARNVAEAGGAPVALAASAPPPPLFTSGADTSDPIEWGTEVENAAVGVVEEEDDVIELISDSEEEGKEDDEEHQLPAAPSRPAAEGIENDHRVLNQQPQHRPPPPKAAISLLAAGPSKIGLAGAPGTSFIKDPKFATTGLKDDATYIRCGPDGRGGRTTHYTGRDGKNNNANRAPGWGGGVITDHVRNGGGGGGGSKRVKNGNAGGGSKPISQYFGPNKPSSK